MRSVVAPGVLVASADQLATQAGLCVFARGGNAVDAAVATNAAIAVTAPNLCGMGGDLFALVWSEGEVEALNASGRAPGAASAAALRSEGHTEMPFRHDVRAVTVPGCVDGWVALHERFGRLALSDVLAPAIDLAEGGFPASPLLVHSAGLLDNQGRAELGEIAGQATRSGSRVTRPGAARVLRAIAALGRDGFYAGEFGDGLLARWPDWFAPDDLAEVQAEWVTPLRAHAWDTDIWTIPPNSQGYLLLGAATIADTLDLPDDADDPQWAHLLIQAATAAGWDRPDRLSDSADGAALVAEIAARSVNRQRATRRRSPSAHGDTTYLCTTDGAGMAVSLIQSNASGFGSWLAEPATGINLHNRGLGFNLQAGHPAELAPRQRPPHTLCPALATAAGELRAVFGTMGGDAQPQILLQLAVRLFHHGDYPGKAVEAGRWALRGPVTGFDTWTAPDGPAVSVEGHAPPAWAAGLTDRGHRVHRAPPLDSSFGHAHAIIRDAQGFWQGAADPRTVVGSCAGR